MCYFITLVVPSSDQDAVKTVMTRHGRTAWPVKNKSVSRVLKQDECQYLTTTVQCDCGTVLAPLKTREEMLEEDTAKMAAKWARMGWSKAKINRAMEAHRKAAERPAKEGSDSLALWAQIIGDLLGTLKVSRAGLLVHYYSGDVEDAAFQVTQRDQRGAIPASLASMRQDEILFFHKG